MSTRIYCDQCGTETSKRKALRFSLSGYSANRTSMGQLNDISDSTQPFTRTNPETIQAYEEGKQLMEARYGRFDAMKEARHINPYRDGDR